MEFDPQRLLRTSKIKFGAVRAQGIPAILLGVAGIILAVGARRVLSNPESLRELRGLVDATRRDIRPLTP